MNSKRRQVTVKVSPPRKQGRKPNGMARRSSAMIPHPPKLDAYEVTYNRTLRFVSNTAIAQNFTFQNLLDSVLLTTSATAPFDLFFAVKLKKIRAWSIPTLGQVSTIIIIFDGTAVGFVGDRKVHTDSSMGIEPAYVQCSPQSESLASKFQVSSSTNAFNIQCPGGTVIDLDLSFRADAFGDPVAAQNVSVAANVGTIAYRGLDGLALATTKLPPPVGVYTI